MSDIHITYRSNWSSAFVSGWCWALSEIAAAFTTMDWEGRSQCKYVLVVLKLNCCTTDLDQTILNQLELVLVGGRDYWEWIYFSFVCFTASIVSGICGFCFANCIWALTSKLRLLKWCFVAFWLNKWKVVWNRVDGSKLFILSYFPVCYYLIIVYCPWDASY